MENIATPIPETPIIVEKPKKNYLNLILISFAFILFIGGVYYLGRQSVKNTEVPAVIPTITPDAVLPQTNSVPTTVVDPTANWKTYTNSKFNFSFKYPLELTYIADQSDQYVENGISNAMILVQNFDGSKPRTETSSDFQIVIYISNKAGQFNLEDPQGVQSKVIINGIEAIKTTTTQKWESVPTVIFQSSPNKVAIQLSTPKSINKALFDQILSTFKFTE
jgi:hypothetical protein